MEYVKIGLGPYHSTKIMVSISVSQFNVITENSDTYSLLFAENELLNRVRKYVEEWEKDLKKRVKTYKEGK